MAYKLIVLPGALSDIHETVSWYEDKQSGLGKRFIISLKDEIATIKQNPLNIAYDMTMFAQP